MENKCSKIKKNKNKTKKAEFYQEDVLETKLKMSNKVMWTGKEKKQSSRKFFNLIKIMMLVVPFILGKM